MTQRFGRPTPTGALHELSAPTIVFDESIEPLVNFQHLYNPRPRSGTFKVLEIVGSVSKVAQDGRMYTAPVHERESCEPFLGKEGKSAGPVPPPSAAAIRSEPRWAGWEPARPPARTIKVAAFFVLFFSQASCLFPSSGIPFAGRS